MKTMPSLLAPAGNMRALQTALRFGADAVYCGAKQYGLRAQANNFDEKQLEEAVRLAHAAGAQVNLTLNIFAFDGDLDGMVRTAQRARDIGVDAAILSDLGAIAPIAREVTGLDVHVSTQASTTNSESARVYKALGAKRVVSARELSIKEIKDIRAHIPDDLEIETFVHGAMCISYSGRCLLSNYFTGRDANLGACTHPCRWKYYIMEENRPGEYLPVEENERGTYIFNSKDLCMIEHIPDLVDAGIDSFKIEGRMKTALYVADVARTYRQAIDDYFTSPELYESRKDYYMDEISKCTYRQYTTGFFYGKPTHEGQIYDNNTYVRKYTYLGIVGGITEDGYAVMEQRNKFCVGDEVEIMKPDGSDCHVKVLAMRDDKGEAMESCPHPQQMIQVRFSETPDLMNLIRVSCE